MNGDSKSELVLEPSEINRLKSEKKFKEELEVKARQLVEEEKFRVETEKFYSASSGSEKIDGIVEDWVDSKDEKELVKEVKERLIETKIVKMGGSKFSENKISTGSSQNKFKKPQTSQRMDGSKKYKKKFISRGKV